VSVSTFTTGVLPMALEEVVNEGFMARYRALLDAEEAAFDELEHAFEDGDRATFTADLVAWSQAIEKKTDWLRRAGINSNGHGSIDLTG
jgi:hypothetical protein